MFSNLMVPFPFQQALHNTRLLSAYSAIDPRVKYLCYTMKVFTKVGAAACGNCSVFANPFESVNVTLPPCTHSGLDWNSWSQIHRYPPASAFQVIKGMDHYVPYFLES